MLGVNCLKPQETTLDHVNGLNRAKNNKFHSHAGSRISTYRLFSLPSFVSTVDPFLDGVFVGLFVFVTLTTDGFVVVLVLLRDCAFSTQHFIPDDGQGISSNTS